MTHIFRKRTVSSLVPNSSWRFRWHWNSRFSSMARWRMSVDVAVRSSVEAEAFNLVTARGEDGVHQSQPLPPKNLHQSIPGCLASNTRGFTGERNRYRSVHAGELYVGFHPIITVVTWRAKLRKDARSDGGISSAMTNTLYLYVRSMVIF